MTYGVNRCHGVVQYLGEGVVSWTDVVGVKGWCQGVRDAKESPARCRLARWCLVVPVGGAGVIVVASMDGCPTRHVVMRRVLVR